MKKYILYILSAAAVFAACTKTELRDGSDKKKVSENAIVLSATHENNGSQADKTSLQSDDSVLWTDGDCIKLLWDAGSAVSEPLELTADAASADFTVEVESGTVPAYAVCPAGTAASFDGSSLSVTIPATQDGSFANAAIELAPVTEGKTIAFKNLGALLEISVSSADVASIVITAYGEKTIAGIASVSFSGGIPAVDAVSAEASSITLSGLGGAGTYYAAILPDAELSDGFYIELRDASDNVIGQKFTGKALTAARKKIIGLGTIAAEIISASFVKVSASGSGDGSSWDNAMSWSSLKSKISAGNASGKIFLAGGTYTGTETAVKGTFELYGGYDPSSTGTDLSKRNTTSFATEFDGEGSKRLFVWNDASISTSYDGVTFKNSTQSSGIGSAIVIESAKNALFNNCSIENNASSSGVIRAKDKNTGSIISFTSCSFTGNSSTSYATVVQPSAGKGKLIIKNCNFTNNTGTNSSGAIYACSTAEISNCVFSGNASTASNGGAIRILYSGAEITMTDNTFENNSAVEGGAIYVNPGTVKASGNVYTGNTIATPAGTDKGGGVYRIDGAANISMDHDTFTGNSAGSVSSANGSGSAIFAGKLNGSDVYTIKLNKCYFNDNLSGSRGTVRSFSPVGIVMLNGCSFYSNKVYSYASAIHNNGICAIHNCAFQNNSNYAVYGASTLYIGGRHMLVTNSSIRLSANAGAAIYAASGDAIIANNTFVNSANNTADSLQVAIKSNQTITSYGHNIYSKLYQETENSYTLEDSFNHTDVQYKLTQEWVGSPYYLIKWTRWNDGEPRPEGFVETTPARVTAAIEAFDEANRCNFKAWLESLSFDGGDALQTDIRGIARSTEAIWPGSYDNSATYPLP
ncbi:MAG: right-handed parallel beta-helix repeat-containing protein [Bacteroidales bacterium]|nr:right-handed parallel beta-helix repeat-containing protein [Bacteroidales bacterium]